MSRENVERVRALHEAFDRGDYDTALSALAPDVEWHAPPGMTIGEEVFRGREEVQRGFALWLDSWETHRFEPTRSAATAITCSSPASRWREAEGAASR